jgi:hypothetical protein
MAVGCGEGSDRLVSPANGQNSVLQHEIIIEPPTSIFPGDTEVEDLDELGDNDETEGTTDDGLATGEDDVDDYDGPWFKDKKERERDK